MRLKHLFLIPIVTDILSTTLDAIFDQRVKDLSLISGQVNEAVENFSFFYLQLPFKEGDEKF